MLSIPTSLPLPLPSPRLSRAKNPSNLSLSLSPPPPSPSSLGACYSTPSSRDSSRSRLVAHRNSAQVSRERSGNDAPGSDWWKWSTPTAEDYEKKKTWSRISSPGKLVGLKKRSGEEVKMVGEWRVGAVIGKGTSGRVRIARHTKTNEFAAIKMVKRQVEEEDPDYDAATIQREITVMKLVESPFIVRLLDVFENETHMYLITEYCAQGELYHFVTNHHLPEELVHKLFSQLISAISHLRLFNMAHRDIKFENLLLDQDHNLKLGDFGMAAYSPVDRLLSTSCGSPHYASPEIVTGLAYDGGTSDIWSCGVVLFALIARELPFDDNHMPTLLRRIKRGQYTMHKAISGAAADLISKILVVNPEHRIKFEDIVAHPFLQAFGPYEPPAPEMPFPLSEGIVEEWPTKTEDLDLELIEHLQVVLGSRSRKEVEEAVLAVRTDSERAKIFYAILRNFRSRAKAERFAEEEVSVITAERLVRYPVSRSDTDTAVFDHGGEVGKSELLSVLVPMPEIPRPSTPSPEKIFHGHYTSNTRSPSLLNEDSFSDDREAHAEDQLIFPTLPLDQTSRSLPGSPARRPIRLSRPRPHSIATDTLMELTSTPDGVVNSRSPPRPMTSPRGKKFSIMHIKGLFSPKLSSGQETVPRLRYAPAETPLKVKRSSGVYSFGRLMRGLGWGSPMSPEPEVVDAGRKLTKKKSWAWMERRYSTLSFSSPSTAATSNSAQSHFSSIPSGSPLSPTPLPGPALRYPSIGQERHRPAPLQLSNNHPPHSSSYLAATGSSPLHPALTATPVIRKRASFFGFLGSPRGTFSSLSSSSPAQTIDSSSPSPRSRRGSRFSSLSPVSVTFVRSDDELEGHRNVTVAKDMKIVKGELGVVGIEDQEDVNKPEKRPEGEAPDMRKQTNSPRLSSRPSSAPNSQDTRGVLIHRGLNVRSDISINSNSSSESFGHYYTTTAKRQPEYSPSPSPSRKAPSPRKASRTSICPLIVDKENSAPSSSRPRAASRGISTTSKFSQVDDDLRKMVDGLNEFDEEGVVERKMFQMKQSFGIEDVEDQKSTMPAPFNEEEESERRCAEYLGY